jgi:hypothetical protein
MLKESPTDWFVEISGGDATTDDVDGGGGIATAGVNVVTIAGCADDVWIGTLDLVPVGGAGSWALSCMAFCKREFDPNHLNDLYCEGMEQNVDQYTEETF